MQDILPGSNMMKHDQIIQMQCRAVDHFEPDLLEETIWLIARAKALKELDFRFRKAIWNNENSDTSCGRVWHHDHHGKASFHSCKAVAQIPDLKNKHTNNSHYD